MIFWYFCPNLLETLDQEFHERNYEKIFRLHNLPKLKKALKNTIEQELFQINYNCYIYKEAIIWFDNINKNKNTIQKKLEKKIKNEIMFEFISFYLGSTYQMIFKNHRLLKFCKHFLEYLQNEKYTKILFQRL